MYLTDSASRDDENPVKGKCAEQWRILGKERRDKMTEKTTIVDLAPDGKSLGLVEPQNLAKRIDDIHNQIARRAFEIFQCSGGQELDNWFKAEAELLHSSDININESESALNIEAEVPGFNASELEVSIEPRRLIISGKKETSKEEKKRGKSIYQEQCSSELLRVIDLPAEVVASKATATLRNGVLELNMPKIARLEVKVKAA
jgi:HSP20 family molecular chaperone IbpA